MPELIPGIIPDRAPVERCSTCAYRPGTSANSDRVTLIKAQLCLETRVPFYCHEAPEGYALCRGWVDALALRMKKGADEGTPQWKHDVKDALLELIASAEDADNAGVPFDVVAESRRLLQEHGVLESEHA